MFGIGIKKGLFDKNRLMRGVAAEEDLKEDPYYVPQLRGAIEEPQRHVPVICHELEAPGTGSTVQGLH